MSDHLIVQRRKEEQRRNEELASLKYYAATAEKSRFEHKTNAKIFKNKILATYKTYQADNVASLMERKLKLKSLLEADETLYKQALIDQEETTEERLSRMRMRVADLKKKREAERLEQVEQLLLKKWRNENQDLKMIKSKLEEKKIAASLNVQVEEQRARKAQEMAEKKRYDELYELDRQKKIAREEADAARRKALNQEMIKKLIDQLESLRVQELEEKRLIENEGRIMRQQAELQALHDARVLEAKRKAQREIREDLDANNKERIARRVAEEKAALELDMRIVKEFMKQDSDEKESKIRKKGELRSEMLEYQQYLQEMRAFEKKREAELNAMYREEEDRIWTVRSQKWKKEQDARDRLMFEVLEGRKEQLKVTAERNRLKIEETRRDKEALEKSIQIGKEKDALVKEELGKRNEQYSTALLDQIREAERRQRAEREREQREIDAHNEIQLQFKRLLARETEKLHAEFEEEFRRTC